MILFVFSRIILISNITEFSKTLKELQSKGVKKAHWNIKLKHADVNTMSCTT